MTPEEFRAYRKKRNGVTLILCVLFAVGIAVLYFLTR